MNTDHISKTKLELFFKGCLWKYEEQNQNLTTKNGDWKYATRKWMIPNERETGKIEDVETKKVLGDRGFSYENDDVILQTIDGSQNQSWTRSKDTGNGYFTLENKLSQQILCSLPNSLGTYFKGISNTLSVLS